jgi:hypothetical protein
MMIELIDQIVEGLSDARLLAIEKHDHPMRVLMADLIGRIEAHRPDMVARYGEPDKQIIRVEVECSTNVSCASRDDLINLLTGIETGCVDGNVTFCDDEG